eukprot:GHVN01038278.1.p1 GENE.GHVN01038278.1~~GHVN01038278.1.p1  ORF type:complete len:624 (-),score=83.73 GHVN01038278.1:19-1890(-)
MGTPGMFGFLARTGSKKQASKRNVPGTASKVASKIMGIDLGTTNSCVSIVEAGIPRIIEGPDGKRTIPSIVGFKENGKIAVGEEARRMQFESPASTVFAVKRLMGRQFDERAVQELLKQLPYKIVSGCKGEVSIEAFGKKYSPRQISSYILKEMKQAVRKYLGEEITKAVITVPAYFNDSQRQATKDAGKMAGLDVLRVVNEPTAASLAYGLGEEKSGVVAVYDLGGGTFDVSILEINDGVFEVKATNGDSMLGGEDFDSRLQEIIVRKAEERGGNVRGDANAMQRIREAAERIKKDLSTSEAAEINLPFISANGEKAIHLREKITRDEFEGATRDLVEKTIKPCLSALKDSKIDKGDIKAVVLVGGMTRMPLVVKTVKDVFGREPIHGVNPDEAVALGAGVQAGILSRDIKDILLLDVNSLSLGVETLGGVFTKLIERNTTIPARKTQTFTTAADGQTEVQVKVYQGERQLVEGNRLLGEFVLSGFVPAPKGVPKIEISFEIDANGIVNVSAKDLATNQDASITLKTPGEDTKEDVEEIIKNAEQNADADSQKIKLLQARGRAELLLKEVRAKVKKCPGIKKTDMALMSNLERRVVDAHAKENAEDLCNAVDELERVIRKHI